MTVTMLVTRFTHDRDHKELSCTQGEVLPMECGSVLPEREDTVRFRGRRFRVTSRELREDGTWWLNVTERVYEEASA